MGNNACAGVVATAVDHERPQISFVQPVTELVNLSSSPASSCSPRLDHDINKRSSLIKKTMHFSNGRSILCRHSKHSSHGYGGKAESLLHSSAGQSSIERAM